MDDSFRIITARQSSACRAGKFEVGGELEYA